MESLKRIFLAYSTGSLAANESNWNDHTSSSLIQGLFVSNHAFQRCCHSNLCCLLLNFKPGTQGIGDVMLIWWLEFTNNLQRSCRQSLVFGSCGQSPVTYLEASFILIDGTGEVGHELYTRSGTGFFVDSPV